MLNIQVNYVTGITNGKIVYDKTEKVSISIDLFDFS